MCQGRALALPQHARGELVDEDTVIDVHGYRGRSSSVEHSICSVTTRTSPRLEARTHESDVIVRASDRGAVTDYGSYANDSEFLIRYVFRRSAGSGRVLLFDKYLCFGDRPCLLF